MLAKFLEAHAVAPVILAGRSKTYTTGLSVGPPRLGVQLFCPPRYRDLRGPIGGEAVVTLATPEYPFGLPVASLTRTR